MRTDVHQHLWTGELLAALERRSTAPRVVRSREGWTLELAAEPPSLVPAGDAGERLRVLADDGLDRGVVALSSALGAEWLPVDEAEAVLGAWSQSAARLPDALASWGAVPLAEPDPARVDALLDEGLVGLCLPSAALATPRALDRLGPALERLERRGAPLFVHPGPAAASGPGLPAWWPAMTAYVSGLQCAWLSWAAAGRRAHPSLRVAFAALAGLAPLHAERLESRGADVDERDPLVFYDTSSYGPRAIAAMGAVVGSSQLVYGSDRPVVEPVVPRDEDLLVHNPAVLLG